MKITIPGVGEVRIEVPGVVWIALFTFVITVLPIWFPNEPWAVAIVAGLVAVVKLIQVAADAQAQPPTPERSLATAPAPRQAHWFVRWLIG